MDTYIMDTQHMLAGFLRGYKKLADKLLDDPSGEKSFIMTI